MLKVLIVDDYPLVRKGIASLLKENGDSVAVAEAGNAYEALALVEREPWDVLVLDMTLPENDVVGKVKRLRSQQPDLPILLLGIGEENRHTIAAALDAGAALYAPKDCPPSELAEAIRALGRRAPA